MGRIKNWKARRNSREVKFTRRRAEGALVTGLGIIGSGALLWTHTGPPDPEIGSFLANLGAFSLFTNVRKRRDGNTTYHGNTGNVRRGVSCSALLVGLVLTGVGVADAVDEVGAKDKGPAPPVVIGSTVAPPVSVPGVECSVTPTPDGVTRTDDNRQSQEALKAQGFYTKNVDGIWGPITVQAVEQLGNGNGQGLTPADCAALGLVKQP